MVDEIYTDWNRDFYPTTNHRSVSKVLDRRADLTCTFVSSLSLIASVNYHSSYLNYEEVRRSQLRTTEVTGESIQARRRRNREMTLEEEEEKREGRGLGRLF